MFSDPTRLAHSTTHFLAASETPERRGGRLARRHRAGTAQSPSANGASAGTGQHGIRTGSMHGDIARCRPPALLITFVHVLRAPPWQHLLEQASLTNASWVPAHAAWPESTARVCSPSLTGWSCSLTGWSWPYRLVLAFLMRRCAMRVAMDCGLPGSIHATFREPEFSHTLPGMYGSAFSPGRKPA